MSDETTGESAQIDDQATTASTSKKGTAKAAAAATETATDTPVPIATEAPVEAVVDTPVFPAHEELPATGGSFIRQPDGSLTQSDQET